MASSLEKVVWSLLDSQHLNNLFYWQAKYILGHFFFPNECKQSIDWTELLTPLFNLPSVRPGLTPDISVWALIFLDLGFSVDCAVHSRSDVGLRPQVRAQNWTTWDDLYYSGAVNRIGLMFRGINVMPFSLTVQVGCSSLPSSRCHNSMLVGQLPAWAC